MRGAEHRTNLRPQPFQPGKALPLSLGGHGALFAVLWAFSGSSPEARPLIDPADVIEVSMVALPKPQSRVPQKEMARPAPAPQARVQPVPQAVAAPGLAPVEPLPPDAEPPDDSEDRQARRDALMRDMKRAALLDDMRSRPEGPADQTATSTAGDGSTQGTADRAVGDVERARYGEDVRRAFYQGFNPLQDDPGLSAVMWVWIDASGKVLRHELHRSSDNGSFDAAVERALREVRQVPPPPSGLVSGGSLRLDLVFRPEDR